MQSYMDITMQSTTETPFPNTIQPTIEPAFPIISSVSTEIEDINNITYEQTNSLFNALRQDYVTQCIEHTSKKRIHIL